MLTNKLSHGEERTLHNTHTHTLTRTDTRKRIKSKCTKIGTKTNSQPRQKAKLRNTVEKNNNKRTETYTDLN